MKVLAVKQVGSGESDKGKWTRQKVRLATGQDEATGLDTFVDGQLFCHKYVPVPNPGDELDVKEIKQPENPSWLPEIILVNKGRGGGGGGYSGPRVDDPKTRNSIAMQSSLKLAWEIVRVSLESGLIKPPDDERHEWLLRLVQLDANRVYAQVKEAQDS